ncbi:PhzF family phenazine biosynthesis isomerase [Allokutzneria sp. A3M-2-11 16]|uniref:PhzF family phenazine biosynthesis protein n=1 Tax=Allokutzneria sp. A3M-2-11 16 TaxID=2962043 RepID=UPI0020B70CEA|nr:PhzF family phenazine biosynthesis isomerase [Allokutzneria sp. A3M-2-11 16]MCP3801929.1 PhzF family phenazine biosynthesis isomerase [Allokutzneria sp. A3M-2-11 16]
MTVIRYEMVNMFADRPFSGSALTVVPEADGLSTAYMCAVAKEFGTPETAFVLPPSSAEATYRVRVFTPAGETPFGGHSSLGTSVTLARLGLIDKGPVVQECGPRLLSISVSPDEGTVTARQPVAAQEVDLALLTAAAGLDAADVLDAPARTAGFGPAFHYLPVRPGAVERAAGDIELMGARELPDVMVFSWDEATRVVTARVFAPGYGMPEDPACASNALGLGAWLVAAGWLPGADGTYDYLIRQGVGSARVGTVSCSVTVTRESGGVSEASVTGRVVPVARGEIFAAPGAVD